MTNDEKAKAYDEAIKKAKEIKEKIVYSHLSTESCKAVSEYIDTIIPELRGSEDERIRKEIIDIVEAYRANCVYEGTHRFDDCIAYLEKQKENPKNAISIPADFVSDAKCEDRWHKTANSLPDNGRDVLAKDALGNYLIASFDGAQWFVSVYDGQDHPVLHTPPILEWSEIPSEKQKEQNKCPEFCSGHCVGCEQKEQKPAEWSEEDQLNLNWVIAILNGEPCDLDIQLESLISWLKSLRPSWKPNEEQMDALQHAIDACESEWDYQDDELRSLLNDIKKL